VTPGADAVNARAASVVALVLTRDWLQQQPAERLAAAAAPALHAAGLRRLLAADGHGEAFAALLHRRLGGSPAVEGMTAGAASLLLGESSPRALAMLAGAWRHAALLRRCIRGDEVAAIEEALGPDGYRLVLRHAPAAAPATEPGASVEALLAAIEVAGRRCLALWLARQHESLQQRLALLLDDAPAPLEAAEGDAADADAIDAVAAAWHASLPAEA
jgi:hypothetical protein